MKRGFLNKTYASGGAIASNVPASPAKTNGASPSDVQCAKQEVETLREQLGIWVTRDDNMEQPKPQPDREVTVKELKRRLNNVNGNVVISHLIADEDTKIFFLAIDQESKARVMNNIVTSPSDVERVNHLVMRPSPYITGGKVAAVRQAARPGDVLLREFPLLCMPNYYFAAAEPTGKPTNFESVLNATLKAYGPRAEALYRSLHNTWAGRTEFDHRGNGVLTGIYNTNSYFLDGLPSDDKIEYSGVFPTFSRVSHSCCPNAIPRWDSGTMTLELRATRHIQQGAEVTISYVPPPLKPTEARQEFLRDGYHFECTCPACRDPEVSDARRVKIRFAPRPTRREFVDWAVNKKRAETDPKYADDYLLERNKSICELYEREQLIEDQLGWTHAEMVLSCCLALGKEKEAAFWAKKVQTRMRILSKPEPPEVTLALRDIKSSPFWDLRKKFADAAA
ncbi:hypothetical protein AURDEDRAFT_114449 [Auricularia subglabra TFB-10046 SS5]|nr:hypothetical protein AURDEDRAFT_114449 [Auricularia subglabra TFB-10046 SS5]